MGSPVRANGSRCTAARPPSPRPSAWRTCAYSSTNCSRRSPNEPAGPRHTPASKRRRHPSVAHVGPVPGSDAAPSNGRCPSARLQRGQRIGQPDAAIASCSPWPAGAVRRRVRVAFSVETSYLGRARARACARVSTALAPGVPRFPAAHLNAGDPLAGGRRHPGAGMRAPGRRILEPRQLNGMP